MFQDWSWRMCVVQLLTALSLLCCVCGEFVQTLVGDKLTLVVQDRCLKAHTGSLVFLPPHESPRDVAHLVDGVWSPRSAYEDRFSPGGAVQFEAAFNDDGVYELTCSTIGKTVLIQVEVLIPYNVWTTVGQSHTLQCYSRMRAAVMDAVRWDRGSELVLEKQFKSGQTDYGDRFRDRVKLSESARTRGDLSLRLWNIQGPDQGNFYCKIRESGRDWTDGQPAVVRLWVTERNIDTQSNLEIIKSFFLNYTSAHSCDLCIWLCPGISFLLLLLCIIICCKNRKKRATDKVTKCPRMMTPLKEDLSCSSTNQS